MYSFYLPSVKGMGHNAKMKHLMTHTHKHYFIMFIEHATTVVMGIFSGTSHIREKFVHKGIG